MTSQARRDPARSTALLGLAGAALAGSLVLARVLLRRLAEGRDGRTVRAARAPDRTSEHDTAELSPRPVPRSVAALVPAPTDADGDVVHG
jgi:hypothetical protein